MTAGERLDAHLVRTGLARSRAQARELLDDGVVLLDGVPGAKPSTRVPDGAQVTLTRQPEHWVGRAAHKLLGALEAFGPRGLVVAGRRCLDVGASTGGFTQVLLEAGAPHVTALDVGHGQLVPAVAADPRVEERSGTNIRDVAPGDLGAPYGVVVADLSFISLRLALPPMAALAAPDADLVVLVKPQFEVGRERLGRTGVVTSVQQRHEAVRGVLATAVDLGLHARGLAVSPIRGQDGNREYLLWVTARTGDPPVDLPDPAALDALEAHP